MGRTLGPRRKGGAWRAWGARRTLWHGGIVQIDRTIENYSRQFLAQKSEHTKGLSVFEVFIFRHF